MRVLAVAVTYNPDIPLLAQAFGALAPQVEGIAVVDNGSANAEEVQRVASDAGATLVACSQNLGIAAAQNRGIALARAGGFSHVLLLDQDTVLSPGTVASLADGLRMVEESHGNVAAIGPAYYELNSQTQTRAYRAQGLRLLRLSLRGEKRPLASDFIIASGSLIPLSVFDTVGPFREDLFIDLVDVEWCFRARAAGYKSFLAPTATVEHRLGRGVVRVGTRQIAIHVPVRNYYWVRNALWLARQPYTPPAWRLYFLSRCAAFLATYTTLADKRALRLRLIAQGMRDGLRSRLGPLEG